ncbi:MAG TPA: RDD family protein [Planctomycetota bacterium]|nr:RDD family protein [Planctomycetota bacterium]
MQISFYCTCGESLTVPQSLRGRKAFCLVCRRSVAVPAQIIRAHQLDLVGVPGVHEGTTGDLPVLAREEFERPQRSGDTTLHAPIVAADPDSVPLKEKIKAELKKSHSKLKAAPSEPGEPLPQTLAAGGTNTSASTAATVRKSPSTTGDIASADNGKKNGDHHTIDIQAPVKTELVKNADGKEHWKLTCACGKRMLSPLKSAQPYGRCPKCGQRLPLPGYDVPKEDSAKQPQVVRVSAVNVPPPPVLKRVGEPLPASVAEVREDRTTTFAAASPRKTDSNTNVDASKKAADRLRPSRGSMEAAARTVSGRISAWPIAGVTRRLLGEFIDITIALAAAGGMLAWHLQEQGGDEDALYLLFSTMLLVLWFNDGVIPLIWGGSVGKLLVVTAVHTEEGVPPGVGRTLLRATLKWLMFPGWLIGAFDAQQRTLHDLLCGTTVLKSRRRAPPKAAPQVPPAGDPSNAPPREST